ncbi:MAG: prohibitin family protein [Rhodanobacter sp.]|nr:MAG: prohibitin family protein [Rhodanobacter sp.]
MPIPAKMPSLQKYGSLILIVALLLLMLVWSSFVSVGPGDRGVLMTFGSVNQSVLMPGLHMKIPFAQTVKQMNVQIQKSQTQETAASRDLQNVSTEVAVNWAIKPADAAWVYQHLGGESQLTAKVITPVVSNAVKAVAAHYDAEELVEKRDEVRDTIQKQIVAGLNQYKVQVQRVNITNFQFSPDYAKAIEAKQVAQQRAQQATYDLARIKVQAQQEVAQAQGQSQAQKLLQSTLTPEIIRLRAVKKWNGVLPKVTGNGAIPFIGNLSDSSSASTPVKH